MDSTKSPVESDAEKKVRLRSSYSTEYPVVSAAEQELRLRSSFDEDRRRLEATLTKSRNLIDRAERWSFKDTRLPQQLTQLKDAAYDAEDLLADIDNGDQQRKIQGQHSQVSQLLHYPLNFLINLWNNTAKRVRPIQGRLDMTAANLEVHMNQLGLHGDYSMPANRQTSSVVGITSVYGRDEDREKVIELLGVGQINNGTDINESASTVPAKRRKKENVSVLPIYGIGGVGKTTLAQIVYNDQRVADHFELKIWICVSDNFHVESLSKQIIDKAGKELKTDLMDLDSLQVDLKKIAMENRFLLILDDVWNENAEKWQKFYGPLSYGKEGSMILVTTRTRKIANITGTADPILLEGLPGNVYQEFFESCAFGRKDPKDYPKLGNIGRNIAAKLKGSPLAAKTLGSLLNEDMDEGHWTTILNSELWELPQKEGDILPALRLSYQYLQPHLKRCFSLCAIFPEDYEFDTDDLVNIWVALGFVIPQGNMLPEDIATIYLHDLTSRCFLQKSHSEYGYYVMHDLMHALAQFVSVDGCSRIDKGRGQVRIPKTVRHLSICCSDIEENMLMEVGSYHKLRSLIILSSLWVEVNSVMDSWLRSLPNIRCLKLSFSNTYKLPESISNLKHLQYLDVSGTRITTLPESLCCLNNLQVLNIRNCRLECFPRGFTRLHNLRKLYAEEEKFSKISKIGGLTSLQSLPHFMVEKDDQHKIGELKHMTQLHGSLPIKKLENVRSTEDARQAKLDNKEYIDELILEWSPERSSFDHDMEVLEGLQPHQKLKKLTIKHYGGTTISPSWLRPQTLNCLSELRIQNCSELSSLGGLDALASLKVITILECPKLADSEPPMVDFNDEVQRREISLVIDRTTLLKLQSLRNLVPFITKLVISSLEREMFVGEDGELLGRFQSLRNLEFHRCFLLNSLPTELHRLTSLQQLVIIDNYTIHSLPENGLPASLTKLYCSNFNVKFAQQLEMYKSQKNHNFVLTVENGVENDAIENGAIVLEGTYLLQ